MGFEIDPTEEEYRWLSGFIEDQCGILVPPNKRYLLKARLRKLSPEYKIGSFGELILKLKNNDCDPLREEIVTLITTNETFWFRDNYPFKFLKEIILPRLFEKKKPGEKIRIWSAASSTGQEPYSIAMLLSDYCEEEPRCRCADFEIFATDISQEALHKAKQGLYNRHSTLRGLPEGYRDRFFDKEGEGWMVRNSLRKMIRFQWINLLAPFSGFPEMDVIFCRNVMIYFSQQVKRELVGKFHGKLKDEGYFILGNSEPIFWIGDFFEGQSYGGPGIFQKKSPSP